MTTRKSSAWLALLLSCLIALPLAAMADDTELFTTSANPNVLLMLDTTGSMNDVAGSSAVGDLDGNGTSNTKMDILWKVVYTLLNADLSIPMGTATWTCKTSAQIKTSSNPYTRIQVNGTNWNNFPSSGTIQIGSSGTVESVTYSSKSISSGNYYFNFSPSVTFQYGHSSGTTVSITLSSAYSYPYPSNHTEATSTDFGNNLSAADDNVLKARLGLMTFTTNSSGTTNQIDIRNQVLSTAPNSPPFNPTYQNIWNSVTQYAYASGGTPTAKALNAAQGFFNTAYNPSQVCRQNFAVMITDGEDTKGGLDGATGNGYGPDYYCGGSFKPDGWSCGSNTGQVARNNAVIQEAANLLSYNPTVKLFTVGVGISDTTADKNVMREVLRRAAEQANAQATPTQYSAIGASGDNTSRGAGRTFFATDATGLSIAIRNVFLQINAGMYSFTAPTVASVRMTDRNYVYKASFTPATPPATFWGGSLQAGTINPDNTMTWLWDAGTVLQTTDPSNRRIFAGYTTDNTTWSRINFTTSAITPAMLAVDNTSVRDSVVNYVLGYNHDNNAKLGDIFHSKPVVVGPPSRFFFDGGYSTAVGGSQSFADAKATRKRVVYVGTNDGMLHAFLSGTYSSSTGLYDSGTGEELFGFVPYNLLDNLESFLPGDLTTHGYFVDSSPRVADVWIDSNNDGIKQSSEWKTVIIGGLRKGGSGYFALDVTDPPTGTDYTNYPKVLWEYVNPTYVAQTWSEPFIGKIRMQDTAWTGPRDRWVAIFGGGKSDAGTVGASLIVLDIATGTALKTFTTGIDNMVVASPAAVLDASGFIKFVYVADLDGSLYKFDFRSTGLRSNGFSNWTPSKIFQAPAGGQPVYHRVESASIDENNRYLFFGTGNQESPVSDGGTGKFYAIKDADTDNTVHTESNLANLSSSITSLSGGTVGSSQYGWFINFASVPSTANDNNTHTAEKVLSDPVVFNNNVFFSTYTPNASNPCGGGGVARVYGLQMLNAGAGLGTLAGEGSVSKVPYHVYTGSNPAPGGIPSSPSLSIYPSGQSSIFIGFSTGAIQEIKIESPPHMKTIKSWKEMF